MAWHFLAYPDPRGWHWMGQKAANILFSVKSQLHTIIKVTPC